MLSPFLHGFCKWRPPITRCDGFQISRFSSPFEYNSIRMFETFAVDFVELGMFSNCRFIIQ
jgi:hypothetical protein